MKNGHIFLIGFMGAGKSTVAKTIRRMYGMEYLEMDRKIAEDAGMSIPDIFKEKGEEAFRRMETGLIRQLAGEKDMVVSCGGGVPMRRENVDEMRRQGTVVWLTASPETIFGRVRGRHHRPLLEGHMNLEYISALMEERRPKYEAAADIQVSTDNRSLEEIAAEVKQRTAQSSE